jgi:flavin reductase (DIM6/NTAB) family NADH-FMN oxidoreductase RutF
MSATASWTPPADPAEFKRTLGCFPTGITIVTGITIEGVKFGLTASSFQAVSLTPPLVLYSVRKGAASIGLVKASGRFCVNVLRHEHAELAKRFGAPISDRFAGRDWHESGLGNPVLPDAIASFDCNLWASYDGGDHEIIVGEVTSIQRAGNADPLVCFQGQFYPIGRPLSTECEKVPS